MPNGNILEALSDFSGFSLPIDQEVLLKAVVAAQNRGFIETTFQRVVVSMPLGTTTTQTIQAPEGRILKIVGLNRVAVDIHDRLLTVTLVIDNNITVYDSIPLTRDIVTDSIFFPFIQDKVEHILVNNGASDAEFTEDLQFITIDKSFFDDVLAPSFQGQFKAIRSFARRVGR